MLKIACVLSNRCTYYRQKKLFLEMQKDKNIELTLLLTSSLLEKEHANTFTEIDMLFNYRMVSMGSYGGSLNDMAHAASRLSLKFTYILSEGNFDCAMVCGDRWELLPFGMAASYLGLPLIHIQGGEVSGNIDDKVRNALSMLSDLHLVSHKYAKTKLDNMGLKNVYCTGCPSISLLREVVDGLQSNT
jgi:UDP-N-acetylglucosamine 2-epimerase